MTMTLKQQMQSLATQARNAARALAKLNTATKNACLHAMATGIEQSAVAIKTANARDVNAARANGLSPAMIDRLTLTDKRIAEMANGIREVTALHDPVGAVINEWDRPNGLHLQKVRVPIGVILIIYESRPNVTADAACLCLKAGNAVILRGGSEALHSNLAIAEAMNREAGKAGLPDHTVIVVPTADRLAIDELLKLDELINLVIPRGGEGLIRAVVDKSRIPVIKHYKGVCHVFVDRDADTAMAEKIVVNAKCQRPGVCNAIETLLVDEAIAPRFLPQIGPVLHGKNVELRGDAKTQELLTGVLPLADIKAATEDDWYAEYLNLTLAIRVVNGVDEAIDHIARYGSAHSDAIVTRDRDTAEKFLREVDSSSVFWNASTRFADGGQYGFGAEIGISTDKLHARGPMGLDDLTSYKYVVTGDGQVRE
jgi:glutamate-5-semialdehyde dehydrogenase